jgi:hypothetical protein
LIFVYRVREGFDFIILHMEIQFSQYQLFKRLSFPHCVLLGSYIGVLYYRRLTGLNSKYKDKWKFKVQEARWGQWVEKLLRIHQG